MNSSAGSSVKQNIKVDPLAQSVEHNTFNVGVLGSNPKRITSTKMLRHPRFVFPGGFSPIVIDNPLGNLLDTPSVRLELFQQLPTLIGQIV